MATTMRGQFKDFYGKNKLSSLGAKLKKKISKKVKKK